MAARRRQMEKSQKSVQTFSDKLDEMSAKDGGCGGKSTLPGPGEHAILGSEVSTMLTFNHFNFNVADLDKSLQFYKDALDLEPVGRKDAPDGRFTIVYLGDGKTDFRLELTWLRDHPQKYDLGECEFHLALRADRL